MQEWTAFVGKTTMPKRGSKNHYVVAVVKKTAGCTEVVGHGSIGSMCIL